MVQSGLLLRSYWQVELCPWRDSNGNVDIRIFARDHCYGAGADAGAPAGLPAADGGLDTNQTYDPVSTASSFGSDGGAIAHGEVFNYTVPVAMPAPGRRLTVTIAWTDPAGAIDDAGTLVSPLERQRLITPHLITALNHSSIDCRMYCVCKAESFCFIPIVSSSSQ